MINPTALIDANNFYASCEQMIDPALANHPLVILSNNDGCIISRSPEARELNIPMGVPYFKVNYKLKRLGVQVRSSNYALYGDMSSRLMSLLKAHCEEIEIYSIDEAFVRLTRPDNNNLHSWARQLRAFVYRNIGIPIAIGIGRNKVQAKIANHLAKTVAKNAGIFDLETTKDKDQWLESVQIENVWGIGKKLAHWCRDQGVSNAKQLRDMPSYQLRLKCGVTGIRLQNELRGKACMKLIVKPLLKKESCVSKSFGRAITNKRELCEAIASHVIRACEKLREQKQCAGKISVCVRTSSYTATFHSQIATEILRVPSNDTSTLLKVALSLTEKIYRPHIAFKKAGVLMQNLQSVDYVQQSFLELIDVEAQARRNHLLKLIDDLNKRYGKNIITWYSYGLNKGWDMRRKKLSPASTTRYEEIPTIKI